MHLYRVVSCCALSAFLAHSVYAIDVQSARSASLGNSGRGGPFLNDSLFLNPSYTSYARAQAIGAQWIDYEGDGGNGRNYTLSIIDGTSEYFQAGAAFTQMEHGRFLHLGASKEIIERYAAGLSGKFYFPKDGDRGPVRDLTFSAAGLVNDWLQAGIVIDNLFQTPYAREFGFYREFVLGLKAMVMGIFAIYFDPQVIPDFPNKAQWGYSAGLEFGIGSGFFLRAGKFVDTILPFNRELGEGHGFGAGYLAPKLSLDYGFQRITRYARGLGSQYAHCFGATIYF